MSKPIIALTRPINRNKEALKIIDKYGGEAFIVPTLELKLTNTSSLKELIKNISKLDWLIFTSPTSIESIFHYYPYFLDDLNPHCKIAVIGHKTAEIANEHNIPVDIIPKTYTAEGLIEEFKEINIKNKLIGIPRTFSARMILPEELENIGGKVILAESYHSIIPKDTSKIHLLINKIINNEIDAITFTSPLTVENLFKIANEKETKELIEQLSKNILTTAIGPITGQVLEKYNITYIYPKTYTVKDMLELIFEKLAY